MPKITCPRCGASISFRRILSPALKPFCSRCGWNLQRAEAAATDKGAAIKLLPVGLALLAIFAIFVSTRARSSFLLLLPLLFALVVAVPFWGFFSTRKAVAAAKSSANPDLAIAQPPLDPALQQLQALPRPRVVRYRMNASLTGVVFFVLVLLAFGIFFYASHNARHVPNPRGGFGLVIPFLFMAFVATLVIVVPIFSQKRYRPLLRDGELALGRVTSQQSVQQGKASYSRINYEFKTSSGQLIQNSVRDLTTSVFEDMTIPVFYDPVDPSKNITPCATYLEVSSNPF